MLIGSIDSPPKSALATRKVPVGAAPEAAGAVVGAAVAAVVGAAAAAAVGLGAAVGAGVGAAAGGVVGAAAGALVGGGAAAGPHAARIETLAAASPARRSNVRLVHNALIRLASPIVEVRLAAAGRHLTTTSGQLTH